MAGLHKNFNYSLHSALVWRKSILTIDKIFFPGCFQGIANADIMTSQLRTIYYLTNSLISCYAPRTFSFSNKNNWGRKTSKIKNSQPHFEIKNSRIKSALAN